jgi:methionyl-tRNA formyltransferase
VVVVFFGTPDFAVPSLRALVGEGFDVRAVVTRPDRPQGRSRSTLVPSPVKVAAQAEGLELLQPERPTDPALLEHLRHIAPDVGVVVAYGHILRPELLAIPHRGMVNVHPSLLPELRGAAPVEWAILNGLETTGVSIMLLDEGMDSGPVLHQLPHHIDSGITGGELSAHLAEMGAQALIEALALWEQGGLKPVPQDHARATFAPKLTRETARITWDKPAAVVARQTLALDPRPGAWSRLTPAAERGGATTEVKLFAGSPAAGPAGPPGEVVEADRRLVVACGEGAVVIGEVQAAGKERLGAADWVRGRGARRGDHFA